MIIYIDILITVNLIVNYFLLLLVAKISNNSYKNFRLILSAGAGSLFSLYIFVPLVNTLFDILVKFVSALIMVLIGFGFKNIKRFARLTVELFIVSFVYAGAIMALWMSFKLKAIIINNSVIYYDVSPVFLVGFSAVLYLTIAIMRSLLKRNAIKARRCSVEIEFRGRSKTFTGIFDTGNSLKDLLSDSAIIFIDKKRFLKFLGAPPSAFVKNYRIIPCGTVTGSKLIEAVRCDKGVIKIDNSVITLNKPILAISELPVDKEFEVLLNPEILEYAEEQNAIIKA